MNRCAFAPLACLLLATTTVAWMAAPPPPFNPEITYLDRGIRVMNADGSNKTLVVANVGSGSYLNAPSWSANGQKLVFTGTFSGVQGIYAVNLDGSGRQLVTPVTGGNSWLPKWSPTTAPDGQAKILFMEGVGGDVDVFLVNLDGTGRQNLTNTPTIEETSAAWAGDGAHIVVSRNIAPGEPWNELVRIELGTVGGSVGITGESVLIPGTTSMPIRFEPSWANAHAWVAYVEFMPPGCRIVTLDTTQIPMTPHLLFTNPVPDERYPTFSPNDSRLAFSRNNKIYTVNPNGTGLVEISNRGSQPNWKH